MLSFSLFGVGGGCLWFVVADCFLFMCSRVKNLYNAGWVCVAGIGGLLGGMVQGCGEGHIDARWRLRRRAPFDGSGGWFRLCC